MSVINYKDLKEHLGHRIVCVSYESPGENKENIALECEDCNEVLLDFDKEEVADSKEQTADFKTEWSIKIKEITLKIRGWLFDGVDVRAILNENENDVYWQMHD